MGNARRPQLSDLTDAQRQKLLNGCGRKGGTVEVPDFIFAEDCDAHDLDYWIGGGRLARWRADVRFLGRMLKRAWQQAPRWWRAIGYALVALTYYRAVRAFGWGAFRYGEPRTIEDLPTERTRNATQPA